LRLNLALMGTQSHKKIQTLLIHPGCQSLKSQKCYMKPGKCEHLDLEAHRQGLTTPLSEESRAMSLVHSVITHLISKPIEAHALILKLQKALVLDVAI
jgi:hypothetical protein